MFTLAEVGRARESRRLRSGGTLLERGGSAFGQFQFLSWAL
jgi:hypothetical protein